MFGLFVTLDTFIVGILEPLVLQLKLFPPFSDGIDGKVSGT